MALAVAFIEQLWIGIQGLALIGGAAAVLAVLFYATLALACAWLVEAGECEDEDAKAPVRVPVRRR